MSNTDVLLADSAGNVINITNPETFTLCMKSVNAFKVHILYHVEVKKGKCVISHICTF